MLSSKLILMKLIPNCHFSVWVTIFKRFKQNYFTLKALILNFAKIICRDHRNWSDIHVFRCLQDPTKSKILIKIDKSVLSYCPQRHVCNVRTHTKSIQQLENKLRSQHQDFHKQLKTERQGPQANVKSAYYRPYLHAWGQRGKVVWSKWINVTCITNALAATSCGFHCRALKQILDFFILYIWQF